ncbi:MAG: AglZ/HisF2 family acetamidino modification protein [Cyclobacteriaceae bacterium]|nr:AglZ/HisF2 family acetamidino modification protein [Cyclobacteriaceae bacterium]
MLRPRIIPCLLVHDKGLVKTVNFKNPKYVGDPINAVRIFNEKESDELMVIDIDATVKNQDPNYKLIEKLASECRMPLCYGGGIKTVEQAQKIFSLGVEKIAISSAAIENPDIITAIAERVGNQSAVVVLDVKKKLFGGYEVVTHNAKKSTGKSPVELAKLFQSKGAGEIIINSVDQDGQMTGFDLSLAEKIREVVSCPLTILGGAGSLDDLGNLISKFGIIGASAGSLFVFRGTYKAVLINYPTQEEKDRLIQHNFKL